MTPFPSNYTLSGDTFLIGEVVIQQNTENETEDYFLQLRVDIQTSIFPLDYYIPLAILKSKFFIDRIQAF